MRRIIIIVLFFISSFIQAQVGIGTISPEQELHVAGENSTIRFDVFNSTNSALYNNGIELAPVFVDGKGDLRLGDGTNTHTKSPLNFLIENTNFIPDDPYGVGVDTGKVINNSDTDSYIELKFKTIPVTVPIEALIEVKFGVTIMVRGSDLSAGPPFTDVAYGQSVTIGLFFCIDIDSDGLDATELSKRYGYQGQYYETEYGGIDGHSYINSQGYLTLPPGTHIIHFYGVVEDHLTNYTSIGYGGGKDYLKIRVYN